MIYSLQTENLNQEKLVKTVKDLQETFENWSKHFHRVKLKGVCEGLFTLRKEVNKTQEYFAKVL